MSSKKQTSSKDSITIYDIAEEAGVSIGTVSRTINNSGYVGAKTRAKIMRVVKKYNFSPSSAARSLVKKSDTTVGIIVPQINNPFLSDMIADIEERFTNEGYSVLLCNSAYSADKESRFVNDLLNRNADGLVMISNALDDDEELISRVRGNLKVIAFESNITGIDSFRLTNWQGAFDATEHLISLGHRKIACVGIYSTLRAVYERYKGYCDALYKHRIEPKNDYMIIVGPEIYDPCIITKPLLELDDPPTAIFAINDYTAIGAYQTIQDMGLRVGADISVAGFDNIPISRLVNPALTTVNFSTDTIAELMVEFLLKRIRGQDIGEPKQILFPTQLILRDSTQPVRRS